MPSYEKEAADEIFSDFYSLWGWINPSDLLVFFACCSAGRQTINYQKAGRKLIPQLFLAFWRETLGMIDKRTELCLFAMQHWPISSVLLNLLLWSAVFERPDTLINFLAEYSVPEEEMEALKALFSSTDICHLILAYALPEERLPNFIRELFSYQSGYNLPLFPQMFLFSRKEYQGILENIKEEEPWIRSGDENKQESDVLAEIVDYALRATLKQSKEFQGRGVPCYTAFFAQECILRRIGDLRVSVANFEERLKKRGLLVVFR